MSSKCVADALISMGLKITNKTVDSYVRALDEARLFYRANRFDLHGKEMLRMNPKQYVVDLGLRSFLEGCRSSGMGCLFENAVYLQLFYKG